MKELPFCCHDHIPLAGILKSHNHNSWQLEFSLKNILHFSNGTSYVLHPWDL
jgi:hypothetical protein